MFLNLILRRDAGLSDLCPMEIHSAPPALRLRAESRLNRSPLIDICLAKATQKIDDERSTTWTVDRPPAIVAVSISCVVIDFILLITCCRCPDIGGFCYEKWILETKTTAQHLVCLPVVRAGSGCKQIAVFP